MQQPPVPTPMMQLPTVTVPTPTVQLPTVTVPTPTMQLPTVTVPTPTMQLPTVTVPTPPMQLPTVTVPTPTMPGAPGTNLVVGQPQVPGGGILRQLGGGGAAVITTGTNQPIIGGPPAPIIEETPYTILSQTAQIWNGDLAKVQRLIDLRYPNGSLILDLKRPDVMTEIIGMLRTQRFEDVIRFLSDPNCTGPDYVLWEQRSMDDGRTKVARELVIQRAEEVGVKGVGKCRNCTSTELVYAQKQLRSGDEPMTIFVRCVLCHKQWRE
jgi:hypothetical protein